MRVPRLVRGLGLFVLALAVNAFQDACPPALV